MGSGLKYSGAAAGIAALWAFVFMSWGNNPDGGRSGEEPLSSAAASAEAPPPVTSARRPKRALTPDERADLERKRRREAEEGPGSVEKAVNDGLDDIGTSVLGKREKTRGQDIKPPREGIPKRYFDHTPREVCLQLKLQYPEEHRDLDCSSDDFSSPFPWREAEEGQKTQVKKP